MSSDNEGGMRAAYQTKKAAAWAMSSGNEGGMRSRLSDEKKQLLMPNDGAKQLLIFLHPILYIIRSEIILRYRALACGYTEGDYFTV